MSSFVINCKGETSNYWHRTDGLLYYFDSIKNYPLLSKMEERKLLETVKYENKEESTKAIHKLVMHNQRFIASIVRRYSDGEDMLDMISEANIGFIEAIRNFDLSKDIRLITYAVYWIRKKINEYRIVRKETIQKLNGYKVSTYIAKAKEMFFKTYGRYPMEEELIDYVNEKYNANLSYKEDVVDIEMVSIDKSFGCDENESCNMTDKGEISLCLSNNNTDDDIDRNYNSSLVEFILKHLKEKPREIIRYYFGIDRKILSMDDISVKFGISKERIRQIIAESIEELRKVNIKDKTI